MAKFGMFIHRGPYSILASVWRGRCVPGVSERIMRNAKMPLGECERLAGASTRSSSTLRGRHAWPRRLACATSSSPLSTTTASACTTPGARLRRPRGVSAIVLECEW